METNSSLSASMLSSAVREYELAQSGLIETTLMNALNEMIDSNIFLKSEDMHKKVYISSLAKILAIVDSHSPLAWSTLSVLEVLCAHSLKEHVLEQLKKLAPLVSKLTVSAVTDDRKVRLLKVLQTLTYGIKISRPELFIAPLINSLIDWSKAGNYTSLIQLALSVLANLLHRNKIVLSTLMQCVNVKKLMQDLLCVRSNVLCKMEVYKLMFLLEDLTYEKASKDEALNFIKVLLCTILDVSCTGSKSHLQHCILFFSDMVKRKEIGIETFAKPWFLEKLEKVLSLLQAGPDSMDPEMAMLLFKLLGIFVGMEIPSFSSHHPNILQQGVLWVSHHKSKATEALNTMHSVLSSKCASDSVNTLSEENLSSVFLPLLDTSYDDYNFLTSLLNFLTVALDMDTASRALKACLEKERVETFLETIPSEINLWNNYPAAEPVVKMYIYLFAFVCKVVTCCDSSWMKFYTCLLREQRVVSVLAVALTCGTSDLKGKVLNLICSVGFPGESVSFIAKAMADSGKGKSLSEKDDDVCEMRTSLSPSNVSDTVEVKLLLRNVRDLIKQGKFSEISSDQIIELYEYKENINMDYQKSLVAGLTRATEEKLLLHDDVYMANEIAARFRQELSCLRSAFDEIRLKYESNLKTVEEKEEEYCNLKRRLNEEISSCQKNMQSFRETIQKQDREMQAFAQKVEDLKEKLVQKDNELATLQEETQSLRCERDELQEQAKELTKEQGKIQSENEKLAKEVENLDFQLQSKTKQVAQLEQDRNEKEKEILELRRLRDTVFELTGGRKKF